MANLAPGMRPFPARSLNLLVPIESLEIADEIVLGMPMNGA